MPVRHDTKTTPKRCVTGPETRIRRNLHTRGQTRPTCASVTPGDVAVFISTLNVDPSHVSFCLSSSTKDHIVMVNGVSMENVHSNYTIQILKTCGKTANVVSTGETPG